MKLKDVRPGQSVKICGYEKSTSRRYRSKLLSLGLTPGIDVKVIRLAPLGDPIEIEVRGYNLTLRRDESDILIVEGEQIGLCSACKRCF